MELTPFASLEEMDATVEALLKAGAAAASAPTLPDAEHKATKVEDGQVPYVLVPDGFNVTHLGALIQRERPRSIAGTVTLFQAASFVAYVKAFKDEHSQVFADLVSRKVTAILDYHESTPTGAGGARWGRHRVELQLRHPEPWKAWIGKNGQQLAQLAFAEFVEDNLPDIAEPDGATLLEMAQHLDATKSVKFASGQRLGNGQTHLHYSETIDGSTTVKNNRVQIPEFFTVALAPFEGTAPFAVKARLRYRIVEQGRLTIGFHLTQPDRVLETTFDEIVRGIGTQTGIEVLFGSAPPAIVDELASDIN